MCLQGFVTSVVELSGVRVYDCRCRLLQLQVGNGGRLRRTGQGRGFNSLRCAGVWGLYSALCLHVYRIVYPKGPNILPLWKWVLNDHPYYGLGGQLP